MCEEDLITEHYFFFLDHFSDLVSQAASQRAVLAQLKQQQQTVLERHKNQTHKQTEQKDGSYLNQHSAIAYQTKQNLDIQ